MQALNTLRTIALSLVTIGAINWGLIGLFQFDLVAAIFGGQDAGFARFIYTLVGISGIISLGLLFSQNTDNDSEAARSRGFTNPNYATEFAEEPDLDRLYNPSKDAFDVEGEDEDWRH